MIGQWVAFQTNYGALHEGEVISYVPDTGMVTVHNEEEDVWTGPEDHVFLLVVTKR